ncbi:sulfite reductase subunit alpha [Fimbriiglobus ruber]|uniref:assimilatory sulfite reductase (NADPH) n=1 Tax=Fimbriiglobus ruber TaxID=1908690 RepID=A0A225E6C1_9BACT|nr:sulfite reductase subunit alpha [Fimbriiglobus ruber]OWK46358.1 Sulfite reductase [NADPH] flavoprotein alpha-component [Fimbriiglobus ruber]
MAIPVLPESAPFSSTQRAWLNGFFAGVFGLDRGTNGHATNGHSSNGHATNGHADSLPALAALAAPAAEEDYPWHDPALALGDRLKLAEGKPYPRVLMAAMAQLDCGACGYLCKTYSEAIAGGEETDLTKCSPGGKDTAKKLKELVAGRKSLPTLSADAHAGINGTGVNTHTGSNGAAAKVGSNGTHTGTFDRKNPFHAPLLECRSLNRPGSEKDVRFVAFSLRGSGLSYEVGDALGLMPENDPALVEAVLKAMGARGDELVSVPGGVRVHAYDALAKYYVITKVSDALASLLAAAATDASESGTLKTLVEDDVEGIPAAWDVLDLLEQFPSARAPIAEMIAALSPLQPRLYSISSSLKAHPEEVHLTVGVVRYTQGGRPRKGVASNFLTETLQTRQKAGVFVHTSPGFRLPASGDVPVIMVGPGTGIAPFRAFLEDRAAAGVKGKNWLFFGDQRQDCDFLYQDEMAAYLKNGVLTRLDTAFSRDQKEKVYVQHRMAQNAREIWGWLQEGAHFYVCGDARRMALDVDHALHALVAEQGKMSDEAAKEYVKSLSKAKRYQRDVY